MKITIVQGAFLPVPPLMGGAVEKVWFGLGKEFVQQGHEVTHISRSYGDLPRVETIAGVQHLRVPGFDTPQSLAVLKFFDLIYSLRVLKVLSAADILVTNTFWLPILVRDRAYGSLYVHAARYPKGQMRLYRHAARLQTVSTVIANAIVAQEPNSKSRVKVISNPLPNGLAALPSTYSLETREKWILYVGRIHPEKGIELLLTAMQQLIASGVSDWKLILVGPWATKLGGGGQIYYERLRKEFQAIDCYVDWVGSIFEPEKLRNYYRRSGVFIYPSLASKGEASPLAPVEAMAHGCPPIVSDLECFKDYIEDGLTGFTFNHRSPAPAMTLAAKLQALIHSPQELTSVSCNASKKAQDYALPHIADLYLADFASLINHD